MAVSLPTLKQKGVKYGFVSKREEVEVAVARQERYRMNSQAALVVLQSVYDQLWPLCFSGSLGFVRATLVVELTGGDSGYYHGRNLICIRLEGIDAEELCSASAGDFFPSDHRDWKTWHRELAEEVAHEYQAKVLLGSFTEEGRELHRLFWCYCEPPRKHGPDFFTAVCRIAHCLGMEPENLARELTGMTLPGSKCPPPPEGRE